MYHVLDTAGYVSPQEAAERAAVAMRCTRPREWKRLYSAFRHLSITQKDVGRLAAMPTDASVELLGIASMNHSGFVRQAAVEALRRQGHARSVPYILLRLSDWVPQVRQAAETALDGMLRGDLASKLLQYGFLLTALERVERVDLSPIRQRVDHFLRGPDGRENLERGLKSTDAGHRAFCFRVLESELVDRPELVDLAVADRDARIRLWIARLLLTAPFAGSNRWLEQLLHDPCSRVQTELIRRMSSDECTELVATIEELIFANTPSVRGAARFVLGQRGRTDFATAYRQQLVSSTVEIVQPGWVAGLAETGTADDFAMVERFVGHPRSKVRSAAVSGCVRLDVSRGVPIAISHLDDPSGRVRRVVVKALTSHRTADTTAAAASMLVEGSPKGRLAAFAVLSSMGGWSVVPFALRALIQSDEQLSRAAWSCLQEWDSRCFTQGWIRPAEPELSSIRDGLEKALAIDLSPPAEARRAWDHLRDYVGEADRPDTAEGRR
jgi:HEAT repeat protein